MTKQFRAQLDADELSKFNDHSSDLHHAVIRQCIETAKRHKLQLINCHNPAITPRQMELCKDGVFRLRISLIWQTRDIDKVEGGVR